MPQKKVYAIAVILLWSCITTGCKTAEEEKAEAKAKEFAESYFNLCFDEASAHCTPESRKWLSFRATNITESDLLAIHSSSPAMVYGTDIIHFNDTTAVIRCTLHNVLAADSLEQQKGRLLHKATYDIPLIRTNDGKWYVRMEGPLQNAE